MSNTYDAEQATDEQLEDQTETEQTEDEVDEQVEDEQETESDEQDSHEDEEIDAGAEQQPSRGNRDIGLLRAERRRLAEDNARLTREVAEFRQSQQQQQHRETAQERAERLALMSPEDRIREEMREAIADNDRKNQQLMAQLADTSDKTSFDAFCSSHKLAQKLAPEVERRLADLRGRGQNLPRSVVLTYLVGERALAAQAGSKKEQRTQQFRRQQARPANGAGDTGGARQRRGGTVEDMEARYGDVPI